MNLDELRSVQSKERSKDSLQHLRESFYGDVGAYIRGLREERERAAERASDPFDSAEVNQLTDEIQTAEEVVEAVYERRVGKVVKRASLAAAGIPADEEGLTSEEQVLFSDLVERIESNKTTVLDVLAGEESSPNDSETTETQSRSAPESAPNSTPESASNSVSNSASESAPDSVADSNPGSEPDSASNDRPTDEAAAIAGNDDAEGATAESSTPSEPTSPASNAREPDPTATDADGSATVAPDSAEAGTASASSVTPETGTAEPESAELAEPTEESPSDSAADRTTVRITQDVGSILGVDEREYDLTSEDVVALPTQNAGPLIERDAAEKLD